MPSVLNKKELIDFLNESYRSMVTAAIKLSVQPGQSKDKDFHFRLTYAELKLNTQRNRLRKETLDYVLDYFRSTKSGVKQDSDAQIIHVTLNLMSAALPYETVRLLIDMWRDTPELKKRKILSN